MTERGCADDSESDDRAMGARDPAAFKENLIRYTEAVGDVGIEMVPFVGTDLTG